MKPMYFSNLRVLSLSSKDLQSALNVWLIRDMMTHRAIDTKDIASEIDRSTEWVRRQIGVSPRTDKYTPDQRQRNLALIEDAITRITDRRGGVPEICCGLEGYTRTIEAVMTGGRHGLQH